jgi:hypothetical protein
MLPEGIPDRFGVFMLEFFEVFPVHPQPLYLLVDIIVRGP